jgi:hypothetical protein
MAFRNRIRLPFYLTRPQFPDEKDVSIMADGTRKTRSIVVSKVYEGVTDKFPEWVHERLKLALNHDYVLVEAERYFGQLVADGYDIDWETFLDYPYAPASFKAIVTPYNMVNSNCLSCEAATQLDLVDDSLPDVIAQSTTYEFNVFANDTINCRPFTAELMYVNSIFVDTATIDEVTGMLTIVTKPLFFQRNAVKLVTYRVTCENGAYDEADVYANLTGDEVAACLEPTGVHIVSKDSESIVMAWTAPDPAPDEYEWQIVEADKPGIIVDSGTTADVTVNMPSGTAALTHSTSYTFSVRAVCGGGNSEWVNFSVSTDPLDENECGRYRVTFFDEFTNRNWKDITYVACNGSVATIRLHSYKPKMVCALQNAIGQPVSIIGADEIEYIFSC